MEGSNNSSSSISPAPGPPRQRSPLDVDEEYGRAFKTRSFLDLWSHAHHSLRHTFSSYKLSSRPSSSFKDKDAAAAMDEPSCSYTVLRDFVLEPSPEALARAGRRPHRQRWRLCRHSRRRVEALLLEYFDVTRAASEACSALLDAAGAARRHHIVLRRLLLRLERDGGDGARDALAGHIRLDNPLSPAGGRLDRFNDAHARCAPLSRRLAAAPAPEKLARHCQGGRRPRRAGQEAARGAYIVGRDLDTVSRMVRRAHDELEHGRDMARIAVVAAGHGGDRPPLLLQEVAREEEECGEDLRCQLEELEEHACLCLLTINRSRRMVAHEMTTRDDGSPSTETTSQE